MDMLDKYLDNNRKIDGFNPLNLCTLLRFCEGEIFYSSTFGNIKLINIGIKKDYLLFEVLSTDTKITINPNGTLQNIEGGEMHVFPSIKCRSWEEWVKENYSSINTWKDIEEQLHENVDEINTVLETQSINKVITKIATLIKVGYGGIPLIGYNCFRINFKLDVEEYKRGSSSKLKDLLCFKSKKLAIRFISFEENRELIRELLF